MMSTTKMNTNATMTLSLSLSMMMMMMMFHVVYVILLCFVIIITTTTAFQITPTSIPQPRVFQIPSEQQQQQQQHVIEQKRPFVLKAFRPRLNHHQASSSSSRLYSWPYDLSSPASLLSPNFDDGYYDTSYNPRYFNHNNNVRKNIKISQEIRVEKEVEKEVEPEQMSSTTAAAAAARGASSSLYASNSNNNNNNKKQLFRDRILQHRWNDRTYPRFNNVRTMNNNVMKMSQDNVDGEEQKMPSTSGDDESTIRLNNDNSNNKNKESSSFRDRVLQQRWNDRTYQQQQPRSLIIPRSSNSSRRRSSSSTIVNSSSSNNSINNSTSSNPLLSSVIEKSNINIESSNSKVGDEFTKEQQIRMPNKNYRIRQSSSTQNVDDTMERRNENRRIKRERQNFVRRLLSSRSIVQEEQQQQPSMIDKEDVDEDVIISSLSLSSSLSLFEERLQQQILQQQQLQESYDLVDKEIIIEQLSSSSILEEQQLQERYDIDEETIIIEQQILSLEQQTEQIIEQQKEVERLIALQLEQQQQELLLREQQQQELLIKQEQQQEQELLLREQQQQQQQKLLQQQQQELLLREQQQSSLSLQRQIDNGESYSDTFNYYNHYMNNRRSRREQQQQQFNIYDDENSNNDYSSNYFNPRRSRTTDTNEEQLPSTPSLIEMAVEKYTSTIDSMTNLMETKLKEIEQEQGVVDQQQLLEEEQDVDEKSDQVIVMTDTIETETNVPIISSLRSNDDDVDNIIIPVDSVEDQQQQQKSSSLPLSSSLLSSSTIEMAVKKYTDTIDSMTNLLEMKMQQQQQYENKILLQDIEKDFEEVKEENVNDMNQSWNMNEKTILDNIIPNAGNGGNDDDTDYDDQVSIKKEQQESKSTISIVEDNNDRNATNSNVLNTYYEAVQESLSLREQVMNEYHEFTKSSNKNSNNNDIDNPVVNNNVNQPNTIAVEEETTTVFVDELEIESTKSDNDIPTFVDDEQYNNESPKPKIIASLQDMVTYQQLQNQHVQRQELQGEDMMYTTESHADDDELSADNSQILNQEKEISDDVNTIIIEEEEVGPTTVQIDDNNDAWKNASALLNEERSIESSEKSINTKNMVTAFIEVKVVDLVVDDTDNQIVDRKDDMNAMVDLLNDDIDDALVDVIEEIENEINRVEESIELSSNNLDKDEVSLVANEYNENIAIDDLSSLLDEHVDDDIGSSTIDLSFSDDDNSAELTIHHELKDDDDVTYNSLDEGETAVVSDTVTLFELETKADDVFDRVIENLDAERNVDPQDSLPQIEISSSSMEHLYEEILVKKIHDEEISNYDISSRLEHVEDDVDISTLDLNTNDDGTPTELIRLELKTIEEDVVYKETLDEAVYDDIEKLDDLVGGDNNEINILDIERNAVQEDEVIFQEKNESQETFSLQIEDSVLIVENSVTVEKDIYDDTVMDIVESEVLPITVNSNDEWIQNTDNQVNLDSSTKTNDDDIYNVDETIADSIELEGDGLVDYSSNDNIVQRMAATMIKPDGNNDDDADMNGEKMDSEILNLTFETIYNGIIQSQEEVEEQNDATKSVADLWAAFSTKIEENSDSSLSLISSTEIVTTDNKSDDISKVDIIAKSNNIVAGNFDSSENLIGGISPETATDASTSGNDAIDAEDSNLEGTDHLVALNEYLDNYLQEIDSGNNYLLKDDGMENLQMIVQDIVNVPNSGIKDYNKAESAATQKTNVLTSTISEEAYTIPVERADIESPTSIFNTLLKATGITNPLIRKSGPIAVDAATALEKEEGMSHSTAMYSKLVSNPNAYLSSEAGIEEDDHNDVMEIPDIFSSFSFMNVFSKKENKEKQVKEDLTTPTYHFATVKEEPKQSGFMSQGLQRPVKNIAIPSVLKQPNGKMKAPPKNPDNQLFTLELKKEVPRNLIQGAALNAVITLSMLQVVGLLDIDSTDLIIAAVVASYLSITRGTTGNITRNVGETTWYVTDKIIHKVLDQWIPLLVSSAKESYQSLGSETPKNLAIDNQREHRMFDQDDVHGKDGINLGRKHEIEDGTVLVDTEADGKKDVLQIETTELEMKSSSDMYLNKGDVPRSFSPFNPNWSAAAAYQSQGKDAEIHLELPEEV